MERYCLVATPWGPFTIVARGKELIETRLPVLNKADCLRDLKRRRPHVVHDPDLLPDLQDAIDAYYHGERVTFRVKLLYDRTTEFERDVLSACRRIPYGRVRSYGDLARQAGSPGAARAVGSVMARNRHPLIVPCHRVVASGNKAGGFSSAGGISQKLAMLELEGAAGLLR